MQAIRKLTRLMFLYLLAGAVPASVAVAGIRLAQADIAPLAAFLRALNEAYE